MIYIYYTLLAALLFKIAYIDFKEQLIDDKDILIGLIWAFLWKAFYFNSALDALYGALWSGILFFTYYWCIKKYYGQEYFGAGDVTLNVLLGAILGFEGSLLLQIWGNLIILLFCIILILAGIDKNEKIPLAPLYVTAGALCLLVQNVDLGVILCLLDSLLH